MEYWMFLIPLAICIIFFFLIIRLHASRESEKNNTEKKISAIESATENKIKDILKEKETAIAQLNLAHQSELFNLRANAEQRIKEAKENIQLQKDEMLSLSEKELMMNCLYAISTYASRIERIENELSNLSISIDNLKKPAEKEIIPYIQDKNISNNELIQIATETAKRIDRIQNVTVKNALIKGTVVSQHKSSTWSFAVDFNDHGKLTGNYKISSDNSVSTIPERFAKEVAKEIVYRMNSNPK